MARDRWESCYVYRTPNVVQYLTIQGVRQEKVRNSDLAIAELGQQGWEIAASDRVISILVFKRRIE